MSVPLSVGELADALAHGARVAFHPDYQGLYSDGASPALQFIESMKGTSVKTWAVGFICGRPNCSTCPSFGHVEFVKADGFSISDRCQRIEEGKNVKIKRSPNPVFVVAAKGD